MLRKIQSSVMQVLGARLQLGPSVLVIVTQEGEGLVVMVLRVAVLVGEALEVLQGRKVEV